MKKIVKRALFAAKNRYYLSKYRTSSLGTVEWLIGAEIKYGGIVTKVPRNKVSPKDPRTEKELGFGGMTGGDRMLHHGYARKYSEYLMPYVRENRRITLVEFGILKGTGIAIWCDLFQNGRILGLDIDLGHINSNMGNLKKLGAFWINHPEVYEFDQLLDNADRLGSILNGDKIDICIDDGLHSIDSILNTMKTTLPHLADEFVYFVEDNKDVHNEIGLIYPDFLVDNEDRLTIVSRRYRL